MRKIVIINGPNLNFLGKREISKYGTTTYQELVSELEEHAKKTNDLFFFQSNHEGEICDYIQKIINEKIDGVIVNPGAYTHTSVSLRDSLLLLSVPIIEVHISDIKERESFRKTNLINDICEKSFIGHGVNGYKMGIDYLNEK